MLEFEVKARVPAGEEARVEAALGDAVRVIRQEDQYFGHPVREFGVTDEALRVRIVDGGDAEVTYKGPKLDARSKARREVTTRVVDADAFGLILDALGFRRVAVVRKSRSVHAFHGFEAAFDVVDGLPGAFLELERGLPEGTDVTSTREEAFAALDALGITATERRSYLELLLAASDSTGGGYASGAS